MTNDILVKYLNAKRSVIEHGYSSEIAWQRSRNFDDVDESTFLRELAWVILTSGMRETVVRQRFQGISRAFLNWTSASAIAADEENCRRRAVSVFNHRAKVSAILSAARRIAKTGFTATKMELEADPIMELQKFSYIGPVTAYHLAKNLGLEVAKPDRHLVRIAKSDGYDNVQVFCRTLSNLTGDSVPVVDIVLWRYATIEPDYESIFNEAHA